MHEFTDLFVTIAETGSLAAAARRHSISPSLASRRLSQIEVELGAKLVNRTTRMLALTDAGRLYLDWARDALRRDAELRNGLDDLRSVPHGRVRVAMDAWIASSYLPDILKHFSVEFPEITIDVSTSDYPPAELDGNCDLAVHAGVSPRNDLVGRRAYDYRRFLCASPSYIDRRGAPRIPADLDKHTCLVHGSSVEATWKFRSKAGVESEFKPHAYVQTNSWFLLRTMAIEGLGIAHLGGPLPTADLESGLLVRLLPDHQSIPLGGARLGVWVIHADARPPRRVELLARFITRYLRATVPSPELMTRESFYKLANGKRHGGAQTRKPRIGRTTKKPGRR